jgi:hypothetical protein
LAQGAVGATAGSAATDIKKLSRYGSIIRSKTSQIPPSGRCDWQWNGPRLTRLERTKPRMIDAAPVKFLF